MRMTGWQRHVMPWVAAGLLAACGGGGGDAPDEYLLQDGYRAMIMGGESPLFSVSGDCHGNAWQISAPATLQSFESASAYMVATSNGMTMSSSVVGDGARIGMVIWGSVMAASVMHLM